MQLRHKPAVLTLSRQALPTLDRSKYAAPAGVARGGYILADAPGADPEVILIGTGSELSLAVQAHEQLLTEGIRSRVVSKGSTLGWERYVGADGRVVGMVTFGAAAPLKALQRRFGFEPDKVAAAAKAVLNRCRASPGGCMTA